MSVVTLLAGAPPKITIVGSEKTSPTSSTSLVINKPTEVVSGDLLVAFVVAANRADGTWTPPAGWTERAQSNDGGNTPDIAVYTKTAGGGEGASYTFTYSATKNLTGCIVALRNATYDTIGSLTRTTSTSRTIAGVTVAVTRSALLAVVGISDTSQTITPPADMTVIKSESGGTSPNWSVMFKRPVPAGATGSKTATSTGSLDAGTYMLSVSPS